TMKAVLFDLGHTLIDYYNDWKQPEERAVGRVSRLVAKTSPEGPDDKAVADCIFELLEEGRRTKLREMVEIPLEETLARCFKRFSCDGVERLMSESLEAFYGVLLEDRRLVAGAPEMLASVHAMGRRIGLVSDVAWGLPSRFPLQDMRFYGLDRHFDDMVFSTDVGLRKPNPEIFRIALRHVGARPEETVFVGNNLQADIKGALDVGMSAVLKKSSYYAHDDGIVPSAKISSWDELIGLLER
ncbi:MAG: HAD family hydrolase, partial [Methanomassiliicoccales archaeon]